MRTREELRQMRDSLSDQINKLSVDNNYGQTPNNEANIVKFRRDIDIINRMMDNYEVYSWMYEIDEEKLDNKKQEILRVKRYATP
tara:strand:+ start:692 stop:946 length:255 start_codon:yes stop_codon:yes gene_type:complete